MTIQETKRLILRSIKHEDIKYLYEIWKTDYVQKYNVMKVVPFSEYQESMEKELSLDNLCIVLKESDTVIGHIALSEALETLVEYLLHTRNYDLVTARVFSDNKASLSLLLKLGFKQEGYLKHAVRNFQNEVFDDVLFAKFK